MSDDIRYVNRSYHKNTNAKLRDCVDLNILTHRGIKEEKPP